MPRTLFILGTDPGYCAELQDALQAKISDNIVIVTPSSADCIASAKESDSIIIAGEKRHISELYSHVLRLERQVNRASILAELIRLSITPLSVQEMLERVAAKSTRNSGRDCIDSSGSGRQVSARSGFFDGCRTAQAHADDGRQHFSASRRRTVAQYAAERRAAADTEPAPHYARSRVAIIRREAWTAFARCHSYPRQESNFRSVHLDLDSTQYFGRAGCRCGDRTRGLYSDGH